MRSFDSENLLNDILREGDYSKFRGELLTRACREFRRAHPSKLGMRLVALAASVALLVGGIMYWSLKERETVSLSINPVRMDSTPSLTSSGLPEEEMKDAVERVPTGFMGAMPGLTAQLESVPTVTSQPLQLEQAVITQAAAITFETVQDSAALVLTAPQLLAIVETPPLLQVPSLTDSELLDLFPERPIVLATISPTRKVLLLPDEFGIENW